MDNHTWGEGMMPAAFSAFVKKAPFCVMTRIALESLLDPQRLDSVFQDHAQRQYQKELLFSQLVELMMSVVLRVNPSVHAAYSERAETFPVSDQAVYDKLRGMELTVIEALVADSARHVAPVIEALGARLPAWLPGYRVRVLDGNFLQSTEHRIKELRDTWAGPLPGKVLAVYEQELDLVMRVFLTPDGHAQERTLVDPVVSAVESGDLWIADRNFCTLKLLFEIDRRGAAFAIRQHGTMHGHLIGERHAKGRSDTGAVYEQAIELKYEKETRLFRRVSLELDEPTRDGVTEIHVLTNLPENDATPARVVELYRKRWTIEKRFYEVTQTLECEPNTLGYPSAALFAFCLALVASNGVALLRAGLRAVHPAETIEELSDYYVALEIRKTYAGMLIALPPEEWERFAALSPRALAKALRQVATKVNLLRYRKARRGPKKPPPEKRFKNGSHVSTHELIEKRKK